MDCLNGTTEEVVCPFRSMNRDARVTKSVGLRLYGVMINEFLVGVRYVLLMTERYHKTAMQVILSNQLCVIYFMYKGWLIPARTALVGSSPVALMASTYE